MVEASTSLGEMAHELRFFTPALLYIRGAFDRNLSQELADHCAIQSGEIISIDCPKPFFQGLGRGVLGGRVVDWDHRIYATPHEHWETIKNFVQGIAAINHDIQRYWRAVVHTLDMVDAVAMMNKPHLADAVIITINVVGISGTDGLHHMAPASNPPLTRPYPATGNAEAKILEEAKVALSIGAES